MKLPLRQDKSRKGERECDLKPFVAVQRVQLPPGRASSQEAPRALLAVSGLLVLGAAVGTMLFLGSRSLWWDELFAVSIASPEVAWDTAIELIRADVHPPLYFLSLRAWSHFLQADGEFAARSLNYVAYVFAAILMLAYVRRRPSVSSVLWFLFAFTSFGFVWYLQEARMYAFAIANAICACVVVMDFEERHRPAIAGRDSTWRGRPGLRASIVAARLDTYRPSPCPPASGRTALFPSLTPRAFIAHQAPVP
jgi:hypothetical protein